MRPIKLLVIADCIRWQQRFAQFTKTRTLLAQALTITQSCVVEQAEVIQCFEMKFKLAWRRLEVDGEAQGYAIQSPRDTLSAKAAL